MLTDRFEKFRNGSLRNHGLCWSHYLSPPALSWNVTKIQLKLISDADICLYFEKVMRGGASYISKRYSKANNKYLKSYDAKQEYKHIYLDANNLHCYEMSKLLPENGFK